MKVRFKISRGCNFLGVFMSLKEQWSRTSGPVLIFLPHAQCSDPATDLKWPPRAWECRALSGSARTCAGAQKLVRLAHCSNFPRLGMPVIHSDAVLQNANTAKPHHCYPNTWTNQCKHCLPLHFDIICFPPPENPQLG